jgi:HEAT repeat protein
MKHLCNLQAADSISRLGVVTLACLAGAVAMASAQPDASLKSQSSPLTPPPVSAVPAEMPALIKALEGSTDECVSAAEKLGNLGPQAAPAVPALISVLRYHGLESIRVGNQMFASFGISASAAATALARIGQPALEPLRVKLGQTDAPEEAAYWTAVALARMQDPAATQILLAQLGNAACPARSDIARALEFSEDPQALAALLAAAKDQDSKVRKGVLSGLSQSKDARVVEVLVAGLRDEDREVRQAAALSLMHQANPSTLEALVQALKDPDNTVRNFSAQALGDIKDPRALEPLIEVVLRDKEDLVQFQASRALERITGKKFGQNGKQWQQWWQQEKAKTP